MAASDTFTETAFGPRFAGDVFFFELGNVKCGWVSEVDGGHAVADVVTEKLGGDHIAKKHIANLKYEDISVNLRVGSGGALAGWVSDTLALQYQRKSGELKAADFNRQVKATAEFTNALLTEITFPSSDAGSKDPAYMTLKFAPESTKVRPGSGKIDDPPEAKQKTTFVCAIDGLEPAAVSKIDAFTIKQAQTTDPTIEPPVLEFPNLSIWLDPAKSQSWLDWYDDFLIAGNNDDTKQKNGSLIFLDPVRKRTLATVSLLGLGIFKLSPEKIEAGSERIKRFNVELYVEKMTFKINDKDA